MEIYKYIKLNNGDICLKKKHINLDNYVVINNDNNIILKKAIKITDINDLKKNEFKNSLITSCFINNLKIHTHKYNQILMHIYNIIDDGTKIIKNTILNIKTIRKENEGFCYLENLGISYQRIDSNKCLLEIINQCTKNNITINIYITLENNNVININF